MNHIFHQARIAFITAVVCTSAASASAASPQVAFDFGRTADCADVTCESVVAPPAGEKIIELRLRVSVHLLAGDIRDVEEVRIEISDCESKMRVHSFSPGTRLESHLSEDIHWSRTTERSNTFGASLGGELPAPIGNVVAHVTPSLSGGTSGRETVTEKEKRVAPKVAVVASGTIAQEHGVFFKLRSSPHTSLEGTHDLTVRFVVPDNWRADSVRVCCQATGREKVLWMTQHATWAHTCAPVALYLSGDAEARQAARQFIQGKERS